MQAGIAVDGKGNARREQGGDTAQVHRGGRHNAVARVVEDNYRAEHVAEAADVVLRQHERAPAHPKDDQGIKADKGDKGTEGGERNGALREPR